MSNFNFADSNIASDNYVKKNSPHNQITVNDSNVLCLKTWRSEVKEIHTVVGKSQIMLNLINGLYYDRFDERAVALTNAFLQTEASNLLFLIESKVPEIGHNAIQAEIVVDVKEAVRCYDRTKELNEKLLATVKGIFDRLQQTTEIVVIPKSTVSPPIVVADNIQDVEPKEPTKVTESQVTETITDPTTASEVIETEVPKAKVTFVIRNDMFPTKTGTAEYKKRFTEARAYFSKTENHEKATDYVVEATKLPVFFLVRNVTPEKLSEVYAQAPASVSLEDSPYGLVHRLAVLFLNTEATKSSALNDALVNIALNSAWTNVAKKETPATEQQEILERMNLSQAGQVASKK